MMHANYKAKIFINWLGYDSENKVEKLIYLIKNNNTKSNICNVYPNELTKRFWLQLIIKCKIPKEKNWSELNKEELKKIIKNLFNCELTINGKSRFKEEFVECGGINLKEINFFKT